MALPAKLCAAAEHGSRHCSQPAAEAGKSKTKHPKGWLMAQPFEGPMAVSYPPPGERSAGRGLRTAALAWALVGTSGDLWLGTVGTKESGCGRHCPVLQPVSDTRVCRQLW